MIGGLALNAFGSLRLVATDFSEDLGAFITWFRGWWTFAKFDTSSDRTLVGSDVCSMFLNALVTHSHIVTVNTTKVFKDS